MQPGREPSRVLSIHSADEPSAPLLIGNKCVVDFAGYTDPRNPKNLPLLRKWMIVKILSVAALNVTCTSSIYASTIPQLIQEFRCSELVAESGLSLFALGLAFGPMILAPLSEVRLQDS